jgi:phage terminase Nu1 subunit (DNA packaging protein)
VSLIEQVLATVGRTIAGSLEALPGTLHKRCPALTPEDLKIVQIEVSKACDLAVTASLANLDAAEESAEADATEQDAEAILFEEGGA